MSRSVYDTAWVAKVLKDKDLFDWLIKNQKADGSWGCQYNFYHDRILSTYGVIQALKDFTGGEEAIDKGQKYIKDNLCNLKKDSMTTFGFEFIANQIIAETHTKLPDLEQYYENKKQEKLKRIPKEALSSGQFTVLYYAELIEEEIPKESIKSLSGLDNLVCSPSATAWLYLKTDNDAQKKYLQDCAEDNGSISTLYPLEIFGSGWIFCNEHSIGKENQEEMAFLKSKWTRDGVALSSAFPVVDLDSTAMCFKVLYGEIDSVHLDVFDQFEAGESFVCYKYERVSSVGANVHLLDAIKMIDEKKAKKWKEKILKYLKKEIITDSHWLDKWHLSPYYITSHAIIALKNIDNNLMKKSVDWILKTQKQDGSWGAFESGTCEETAYCVLSLFYLKDSNTDIILAIRRGIKYLKLNFPSYGYPELWVGKVLYCHIGVVKSAIECAILAGRKIGPCLNSTENNVV